MALRQKRNSTTHRARTKTRILCELGHWNSTLVANYIPNGIDVEFQSENGMLGMGPFPIEGEEDADLINAGKQTITAMPGAVYFDSSPVSL